MAAPPTGFKYHLAFGKTRRRIRPNSECFVRAVASPKLRLDLPTVGALRLSRLVTYRVIAQKTLEDIIKERTGSFARDATRVANYR